jgi:hypothetical protein
MIIETCKDILLLPADLKRADAEENKHKKGIERNI